MLRELGNKLKKMEKLGSVDILNEVHEAAEELQKKIDQKSYLLVNSESWEIGSRPKEVGDPQDLLNLHDDENTFREYKSLSEAVLDLRSFPVPQSWDGQMPAMPTGVSPIPTDVNRSNPPVGFSSGSMFMKQVSWPAGLKFEVNEPPVAEESNTYENASQLSLATFTSLLIEFVARLQNLVDSFEELSEKARFKEPVESPEVLEPPRRFWTRLLNCLKS